MKNSAGANSISATLVAPATNSVEDQEICNVMPSCGDAFMMLACLALIGPAGVTHFWGLAGVCLPTQSSRVLPAVGFAANRGSPVEDHQISNDMLSGKIPKTLRHMK